MARKPKTTNTPEVKTTQETVAVTEEPKVVVPAKNENRDQKITSLKERYPNGSAFDLAAFETIREVWGGRVGAIPEGQAPKFPVDDENQIIVKYTIDPDTFEQKISGFIYA